MRECEENLRCVQFKGVSRLACDWQVARMAHVWSMQGELKGHNSWSFTRQNFQSCHTVSLQLKLTTRSSHKLESPKCLVWLKLTFRIPHTYYYKYPYTHKMLRASRKNFERETLEKNKIDSSTIFILWFSKFLYSHPLH